MTVRKLTNRPLQTNKQRDNMRGRAYSYARGLLITGLDAIIGSPPYSRIDGQTIAQRAWSDGYEAALRDVRAGKRSP